MTLAQKIGQLLMIGMDGGTPSKKVTDLISKNNIGGVILFSRNIKEPLQCARLTAGLKAAAKEAPLFIGIDQEGGRVSRLTSAFTTFPSARTLGQCNHVPLTYNCAEALALELTAVGINMNFAPVLDVDTNPKNPIIGDRSFGKSPILVQEHGLAMMSGLQDNKIIACGKHFPGHGDTVTDSHKTLPVVDYSVDELTHRELKPFIHTVQNRLAAIMTAHVLYPQLDAERPATLSKKIISSLLRRAIEFSGMIVSDDLEMKGITEKYTVGDAAVMAIDAGCDLLLICGVGDQHAEVHEALIHAVEKGTLSEERIDQSLNRILALKERFLLKGGEIKPDAKEIKKVVGCDRHRALIKEIQKKAAAAR